jgi:hypothetical protein
MSVKIWSINTEILENHCDLGGKDMTPFNFMINPEENPEVTTHLEDLFYYAQLREQGEDTPNIKHELKDTVSIEQVPALLRAMGLYPSEYELTLLVNQLSLKALEAGKPERVTFNELVKSAWRNLQSTLCFFIKALLLLPLVAYLNYRDGIPPTEEDILDAMQRAKAFSMGDLKTFLQTYGESMTSEEFDSVAHLFEDLVQSGTNATNSAP